MGLASSMIKVLDENAARKRASAVSNWTASWDRRESIRVNSAKQRERQVKVKAKRAKEKAAKPVAPRPEVITTEIKAVRAKPKVRKPPPDVAEAMNRRAKADKARVDKAEAKSKARKDRAERNRAKARKRTKALKAMRDKRGAKAEAAKTAETAKVKAARDKTLTRQIRRVKTRSLQSWSADAKRRGDRRRARKQRALVDTRADHKARLKRNAALFDERVKGIRALIAGDIAITNKAMGVALNLCPTRIHQVCKQAGILAKQERLDQLVIQIGLWKKRLYIQEQMLARHNLDLRPNQVYKRVQRLRDAQVDSPDAEAYRTAQAARAARLSGDRQAKEARRVKHEAHLAEVKKKAQTMPLDLARRIVGHTAKHVANIALIKKAIAKDITVSDREMGRQMGINRTEVYRLRQYGGILSRVDRIGVEISKCGIWRSAADIRAALKAKGIVLSQNQVYVRVRRLRRNITESS